ncbi:MAG: hypothetical protein SGJ20_10400 [Planctomycetota bacterium]|nr:hypothetical protein [Planctomycetota bacterium]
MQTDPLANTSGLTLFGLAQPTNGNVLGSELQTVLNDRLIDTKSPDLRLNPPSSTVKQMTVNYGVAEDTDQQMLIWGKWLVVRWAIPCDFADLAKFDDYPVDERNVRNTSGRS